MWLFVGLGNPGIQYEETRHNIGFMVIDKIAKQYGFHNYTDAFKAKVSRGTIGTETVFLVKPQTYMNDSGKSVIEIANFYKIPLENIIVFHDDINLEFGILRTKTGGGAGGHNGLKSIDSIVGIDYHRMRFGVGHPGTKEQVYNHVLGKFTSDELIAVNVWSDKVSDAMATFISEGKDKFLKKLST